MYLMLNQNHTHKKKTIWPTTIANEEMNQTKLVGSKACKARETCNRRQAARETLVNDVTGLVPDWLIRTEKISLLTAPAEKAKKKLLPSTLWFLCQCHGFFLFLSVLLKTQLAMQTALSTRTHFTFSNEMVSYIEDGASFCYCA